MCCTTHALTPRRTNKRARDVFKVFVAVAVALGAAVVPTSVSAGGPSTSCSLNYYCVSKLTITNQNTTTMTYGWRQYAPNTSSYYECCGYNNLASNDTYSNGGGTVGSTFLSIRNRDNIDGRLMCMVRDNGGGTYSVIKTANWFTEYWVQMSLGHDAHGLHRGGTSSSCAGG